ncbi:hypothetical protein ZWY2020_038677 [Hordeum vulgare]|nr:hypothetical protein ZWY2020_038677 [Hordeum vulgare]
MSASDRALAALCSIVAACPEGRRAVVSRAPDAVPVLVDAQLVRRGRVPGEGRVRADGAGAPSYGDRAAMAEAGATSALLELTLVGTALAQKRASRILEILRADKGKQVADGVGTVATVSAQERAAGTGRRRKRRRRSGETCCMSNEKRAVRQLVQQSLRATCGGSCARGCRRTWRRRTALSPPPPPPKACRSKPHRR